MPHAARCSPQATSSMRPRKPLSQMLVAADLWLGPTWEIVIAGDPAHPATQQVLAALHQTYILPRRVVACRGSVVRGTAIVGTRSALRGQSRRALPNPRRTSAGSSPARHPCRAWTTSLLSGSRLAVHLWQRARFGWSPDLRTDRTPSLASPAREVSPALPRCPTSITPAAGLLHAQQLSHRCAGHFAAVADQRVAHDFVLHVPGQFAVGNHVEQELRDVVGEHLAGVVGHLGREVGGSEDRHAVL